MFKLILKFGNYVFIQNALLFLFIRISQSLNVKIDLLNSELTRMKCNKTQFVVYPRLLGCQQVLINFIKSDISNCLVSLSLWSKCI